MSVSTEALDRYLETPEGFENYKALQRVLFGMDWQLLISQIHCKKFFDGLTTEEAWEFLHETKGM